MAPTRHTLVAALLTEPVVCPTCDTASWIDRPCYFCDDQYNAAGFRTFGWHAGHHRDQAIGYGRSAYIERGWPAEDVHVLAVLDDYRPRAGWYAVAFVAAGRKMSGRGGFSPNPPASLPGTPRAGLNADDF